MSKRYLEIDSTYRNRNQYPNPFDFTVLIEQSGTKGPIHAYDPISKASPSKIWIPNSLTLTGGSVYTSVLNTLQEIIITFPQTSNVDIENDYYNGHPITVSGQNTKILEWSFLSSNPSGNVYFIVKVFPFFTTLPSGGVTFQPSTDYSIGSVFIPKGVIEKDYYNGLIVYNENRLQWRYILNYGGDNKIAGLDMNSGALTGWNLADKLSLRITHPRTNLITTGAAVPSGYNNLTSFFVTSSGNLYVGDFVRHIVNTDSNSYRVTKIESNGLLITVSKPMIVAATGTLEVLHFTSDNAVPFSYNGSMVSQQEMVCYEIELINIVLPNKLLVTGGYISKNQHVYVELQNVSSSSAGTQSIIYSNNPNSKRMLFRAVIDDNPTKERSPFITIDGDGMVQTVKFKPNDNFKFGVYLPSGEIVKTEEIDSSSPTPSDALLQVSALFSIRRMIKN
jgi:hypothetical protein